jgi:hypothetical protein
MVMVMGILCLRKRHDIARRCVAIPYNGNTNKYIECVRTVQCLRWLATEMSGQRAGLDHRHFHVVFLLATWHWNRLFYK